MAAVVFVSTANGASPCAKDVLFDWYDNGRIDGLYALHCYEEAIDAVPPDLRDYADAEEVIARALQDAAREKGAHERMSRSKTPSAVEYPPKQEVAPTVNTSAPSAFPVPLVVLGCMSLVLLSAGLFGYLTRRRREAGMGDRNEG